MSFSCRYCNAHIGYRRRVCDRCKALVRQEKDSRAQHKRYSDARPISELPPMAVEWENLRRIQSEMGGPAGILGSSLSAAAFENPFRIGAKTS